MPAYFAEATIIMKQARRTGADFSCSWVPRHGQPRYPQVGGKAVEGFLHTTFPYDVNMENMSAEARPSPMRGRKNFPNKDPNVNSALGYNCYNIILDALPARARPIPKPRPPLCHKNHNLGVLASMKPMTPEMPVGIIKYMDGAQRYIGDAIAE